MRRSGKIKWGNLGVGLFVTFCFAALLYTSFRGGGTSIFESKNELIAYVENANGLVKGAPVWLAGVEVGNVRSVEYVNLDEQRRIKIVLSCKTSVWHSITADSRVRLGTIGALGDKYVEILPGSTDLPVLEPGAVLEPISGVGMDAVLARAPQIAGSVDSVLLNIKDITGRLASDEGTAGRLITDTSLYTTLIAALDQAVLALETVNEKQKQILARLESTLDNTASITGKMDQGDGSLGKLVNDGNLYDNLAMSTARMDSILAKIDRGEGSAGALVNDDRLYQEISNLVVRINNLVTDIEENPRKYFKFSVF